MITKVLKIFKKDLKSDTIRPVFKDGVVKNTPCCKATLDEDNLRAVINGMIITCPKCGHFIEGSI